MDQIPIISYRLHLVEWYSFSLPFFLESPSELVRLLLLTLLVIFNQCQITMAPHYFSSRCK